YGYITVNGVDPIFQTYGSGYDPGQPAGAGVLPAEANLPAGTCESGAASFPCSEKNIWKNGFSFPNVRNGTYRAWSLLRLMSNGTGLTNVGFLLTASQKYVVSTTPDYIPALAVSGVTGNLELGLKMLRSHYQQTDGNGAALGPAPVNSGADKGGDMGGCILPTTIGVTTYNQKQLIQNSTTAAENVGCVLR